MDGNKKTDSTSGVVEDWVQPGPSRVNSPEIDNMQRYGAAQRAPHGPARSALEINSADEVRQAVKGVLNEISTNTDEDGVVPQLNCENKTLYDVVQMTMKLVDERNKRGGKRTEQQKPPENRKRRRNHRRGRAAPRKRARYSGRVYRGRLSNVAGTKKKPEGGNGGNARSSESESDLASMSSGSTKSGSTR